MRRIPVGFAASLTAVLALAACGDAARPAPSKPGASLVGGESGGTPMDLGACTRCHGDPANGNAAPPLSTKGLTSTADMAVGAHQKHLAGATVRAPIACDECHVVPLAVTDPGHIGSGAAAVVFGAPRSPGLGTAKGAAPAWNPATGTCSNVYCHGGTLAAGGANTAPRWTGGAPEAACGSCHAIPSSNPRHPAVSTERTGCNLCHPQTVDPSGALIAGGKHLDGNVDVLGGHPAGWSSPAQHGATAVSGGLAQCQACHGQDLTGGTTGVSCDSCHSGGTTWRTNCTFCHGDASRAAAVATLKAAPPQGVRGETATTARAVGAHQQHLADGPLAKAIACGECHTVPANVLDAGHVNGARDVAFGALARTAGAAATWNGANGAAATTCATYCHGATLAGGAQKAPDWTKVDGTQAACGTCHGVPPPTASGVHAKVTALAQCATCHPGTVDAAGAVNVAGGLHVNGTVDRSAHHPAGWGPSTGGIAHAAAANTGGVASCVACHGDAQGNGGYVNVACASCHKAGGVANDFGTAAAPGCTACHGGTLTGTDGAGLARAPAPPRATVGSTRPPGAHARHLTVDAAFAPAATFACAQCHATPAQALHASGAVDLAWGAVAAPPGQVGANGSPVAPVFDATANSCASTWCHGNFRNGNARTMSWTGTAADAACGSCHGLPPAGSHPVLGAGVACSTCHAGYGGAVGGAASTFSVNAATHLNGVIEVSGSAHPGGWADPSQHGLQAVNVAATPGGIQSCTACHVGFGSSTGAAATDCNACHAAAGHAAWRTECTFCHGGNDNPSGAPARDTHAVRGTAQATTLVTVGAHTSHVAASHGVDAPLACAECHVTPADATDPGHIDATTATLTFGATAKLGAATPAWNRTGATCASTYCHGATLNATTTRGSAPAPVWTTVNGSQATCGSCHKAPPTTANHHNAAALTACVKCHANTATSAGGIVAGGGKHIDGAVDVTVTGCTTCHGNPAVTPTGAQDANLAAAPTGGAATDTYGNAATTAAGVGAHGVHVLGARSKAVACNACHAVPSTPVHKTGTVTAATITFGNLAATGGAQSVYNADKSCSSSYCHGGFAGGAGTANKTPAWTAAGTLGCTSCHGAPPAASTGHVQRTDCGTCHSGYTSTTVNVATHVDGKVDVVALACTTCHGNANLATVAAGADANVKAAPPVDAAGASTSAAVGAHQAHVNPLTGAVASPIACAECHGSAVASYTTAHANGVDDVVFTAATTARLGGAAPAWNAATLSCASTYCHGATLATTSKGSATAPAWNGPAATCGSCHAAPPADPRHLSATASTTSCNACHAGTVDASGNVLVAGGKHLNGAVDTSGISCHSCHGDATSDAPPKGTHGETATTAVAVGAHRQHLLGLTLRASGFACTDCHPAVTAVNHADGAVQTTFTSTLAAGTVWTKATASCATSKCHGGSGIAKGGATTAPVWTKVDGTQKTCTSCHGAPPPASAGHVQRTDCGSCHPGYTSTSVNLATHVNGTLDVIALACTSCHGDATRVAVAGADANVQAAPPVDAKNNTATTAAGVGAHQAHVNGARSKPVACAECHSGAVPTSSSHATGTTTVAFGTLATTGAVAPAYAGAGGSCSASYCHGNFSGGNGTAATPAWTAAGTLGCASCHGAPPALPHPQDASCADCHPGYTATTVNAATHIDGKVDLAATRTGCASCHGDGARVGIAGADANVKAAPPFGTKGESASSARAVGAHAAHVNTATLRTNPIACSECHAVPAAGDKTHANGTAAVAFGTLARTGGVAPAWNTTALSCASTYCHGATLQGGAKTAPVWTTVDGTQKTCTSCHGDPPPASSGHVQRTDCGSCHTGYSSTAVNLATHMNGTVDVIALACTTCHGDATRVAVANADANVKAAPPVDTLASTATTARGVGVHQAHVNGARSKPVGCAECHSGAVPTTATGHAKGTTTVAFGALAKTGNVAPAYSATAFSCASTYCHGNFTGGNGTGATPAWTAAGTLGCTACHGAPPTLPHPQNTSCGTCHPGYTATSVNVLTHVNGVVDQTGTGCTQCHGTPGRTTYAAEAPPIDTKGNTATTSRGVGAHATHLTAGGLSNAIACTECHVVPAAGDKTHANGTAAITFGALARTNGASPAWNGAATGGATTCSNVYCHGNFTNGTTTNAPNWTGTGQAACGSCHSIPPGGSHPVLAAGTNCGGCHTGYSATPGSTNGTVNLTNHVNGKVDVTGGGESAGGTNCGGCHGTIFNMMVGTSTKVTKHTLATDVPTDTGGTWSGNLKTATPYAAASCVSMCHGDHPHAVTTGGTHEYNVYADSNARSTTSSTATRSKTDFDNAQTNGGLCISCHLNPVDANHPAISKAGYQASAHNFTSNTVGTTTYTWQYTLHDSGAFQRNCTKCHASPAEGDSPTVAANGSGTVGPHASDFGSLLAGTTNPAGAPATFVCYNCHGNGTTGANMSGKDIATDAAKVQGHGPAIDADAKHVTASEDATTYNSGLYSGTNRHASCLDCHDTHMAGKTRHTVGPNDGAITATSPLNGVSGVAYTGTLPANFAAIPAANLVKVAAATAEYQVCFKCHTGWAFGTTPPTGPSTLAETDLAQEFNVNNKSAHPVVNTLANQTGSTAKGLVASQLLAPWNVSPGAQTMTCTDCHNTDAASTAAQGPHGSAVTFMLTGANKAWPYTVAGANSGTLFRVATSETGINTANGLFCRNCHPQQNSAGSNSLHRNSNITGGQHGNGTPSACVSCHVRIPHGGKVSRLIVTTNAPARYKVGTSNFASITKGATKDSYSTSGFPSGFKSSCSEHSSGTGAEAW